MPSPRRLLPLAVLATLVTVPAASASAATTPVLGATDVAIPEAVVRRCHAALLQGAAGTRTTPYIATRDAALSAELTGADGDWDLAAFDTATGDKLAASATRGARELVTVFARQGQSVSFQACRRSGASPAAALRIDLTPVDLRATPDAVPAQLVEVAVGSSQEAARLGELGFDTTHESTDRSVEVVLANAEEGRRLRRLGYEYTVEEPSLPALYRRVAAQDAAARRSLRRALPSGRTTYRAYEDFGQDLKDLIAANPGHTKAVNLGQSLDGRPIEGVEIAGDVGRPTDGRPIFLLGGVTHAREWPSGDTAMEFAIDMARTYKAGTDPRVTALLNRTRVVVVPMFNPDGFVVSRQAGAMAGQDAGDDSNENVTLPLALNDAMAYKRKNCRAADAATMAMPCAMRGPVGVDLNRAYGAFWGGEGSSPDPPTQQYRGPAPFTEPEAMAVRRFGAANQIQTFITQHTFTDVGRWLRQPGFDVAGDEVPPTLQDEAKMKALGDAMADSTGYVSELGYATLGNITGPADDFLYYSQGTFGYTPELRGDNFHTSYANAVVGEYEGKGAQKGRGLREAYIVAGEQAANPADHVDVKGSAPAGRVLRLKKTTTLRTSLDSDGNGAVDTFPETLDTVLTVPASGSYEWHVNPSTRPLLPPRSEAFSFTCEAPDGRVLESGTLTADRGEAVTRNFACGAPAGPPPTTTGPAATPPPAPPAATTPILTPPAPASAVTLSVLRPRFSARRTKRLGGLAVYVRVRGGALRDVRASIVDRRPRIVLSGRRASLPKSGRVSLRRRGVLRPGVVRVRVSGLDAAGRRVTATRSSRIVR